MSKGQYVCQRAAHTIIAEIGHMRVSGDALGAINLFIDEFLALLLMTSRSVDLVHLKTAVLHLLPHSLGKNALVEAELVLKQQVEERQTEYDFSSYEKMRTLNGQQFPQDQLIPLLQVACADYCTLTADDTNSDSKSTINNSNNVAIPPVVVIYVTAIVEHIAEYLLNAVAMTADGASAEHIRVQEVLLSLLEDPQLNNLFQRMNLKSKLEKRVSTHPTMNTNISCYSNDHSLLPTPTPSPVTVRSTQQFSEHRRNSNTSTTSTYNQRDDYSPDISFNEFLESADDDEPRAVSSSIFSIRSSESFNDRPLSVMSNGTVKSSGSKSRFNFFGKKEKRSSISLNFSSTSSTSKRSMGTSSAIASPTTPSFQSIASPTSNDFDDLIRSGKTKKVSLTPNRLTSIEVKEDKSNDVTPWEKFNDNSLSTKPARTKKRSTALPLDSTPPPPLPPLPRMHRETSQQMSAIPQSDSSPPLTPASSVASRPSQRSIHSIIYEERSTNSLKSSSSLLDDLSSTEDSNSLKRNPSKMSNSSSLYNNSSSSRHNNSSQFTEEENKAVKLRFERPSSMVMKRASMGSRPPSFHENVLMDANGSILLAAAGSEISGNKSTFDNLRQEYERKLVGPKSPRMNKKLASLDINEEEPSMIYVVPSNNNSRSTAVGSTRTSVNKTRTTMDRGCQTDPIPLHTLIQQHQHHHIVEEEEEQEAEEEWFIEEEEWEDQAEEEKSVVDWLLGNA